ncbi:hypothetical protein ACOBV8_00450 [Pseudoalteromonas espejiana]
MKRHEMSHYAHLFTILPMPIANACSKTGDILRVNQRFIDVFGYTVDDLPNLETSGGLKLTQIQDTEKP